jgi:hypothetical protein
MYMPVNLKPSGIVSALLNPNTTSDDLCVVSSTPVTVLPLLLLLVKLASDMFNDRLCFVV